MQIDFWLILWCILGVIVGYLIIKAFVQEIVHYGLKGLFIFLPKLIYKLIKALKICIRGA